MYYINNYIFIQKKKKQFKEFLPKSTNDAQGIVSPEYVNFQPFAWDIVTPNELGQCITSVVNTLSNCNELKLSMDSNKDLSGFL